MTEDDKKRVREAFLAAAQSPAADKYLQGTAVYLPDLFRKLADSPAQMKVLEDDIAEHRTTVDRFIAELQKAFPPAAP